MTKVIIKTEGLETTSQSNFTQLREVVNGRLGIDNLQGAYLSGTTGSTPNASQSFRHTLGTIPTGHVPVFGNVYIHSINDKVVDVRSSQADTSFKIFLIK